MIGGAALFSVNTASAFPSRATTITNYCSSNGYDLLPEYAADTCDAACHNNAAGVTAFNNGDYEYFCPAATAPTCTDADNDGYFAEGGDCGTEADFNDNNAAAYPGAAENCSDGIDNDGNGLIDANDPNAVGCSGGCTDNDADGYSVEGGSCGPIDCDDNNGSVNPGAVEACTDGIDNNCNGQVDTADPNAVGCANNCTDQDGDGYSSSGGSCGPLDCNDNDPDVNPGASEVCDDGSDNNCNGLVDSADNVCQSTGECERKWWRRKGRHHRHDDCPVDNGGGDDDGNDDGGNGGGDTGGGFTHPFGWTNPTASHQDFVDENGVGECLSCHSIDPADEGSATSCYNCHGQEWDDNAGGGNGGGNAFTHPFGWTNPTASHQNYVSQNGVDECTSCHSTDPADRGSATSCYNCHGQLWDNNAGGGNGGGGGFTHPFGWTNPTRSHQDFVDENGVGECLSCHSIDPADKGSATSCYNCHGQEWDGTGTGGGDGGDDNEDNNDGGDNNDDEDNNDGGDRERDRGRDRRHRD